MPSRMTTGSLEEICKQVTDGTHDSPPLQPNGVPFIKGKHISTGVIDFENCDYITHEDHLKVIARSKPERGDTLFSNIGSVGDTAYVITDREFSIKNVALLKPDPHVVDKRYFFYLMRSDTVRNTLLNKKSGSAQPFVSLNTLREHTVRYHQDLEVQHRIASILSAYDDLIENNTRRVAILEEMARSLYREWFVHLRFPDHEAAPRVASTHGPIPQDWSIAPLKAITTKIGSGATPRGGKEAYKASGVSLIRSLNVYNDRFEHGDLAFIDDEQAAGLDNVVVEEHDILLNITGASVARCCMVPSYLLPARVNQHVTIIRVNREVADAFYVLDAINSYRCKQQLLALAHAGATREALTKDTISNFEIVLPSRSVLVRYAAWASLLFQQRELLHGQIGNLGRTRDLLLPKLISGEIDVPQVSEKRVEATA